MFVVVAALMALLCVPVSAADTYQVQDDTELVTAADAIMPLVADSWYTATSTDLDSIIAYLRTIDTDTGAMSVDVDNMASYIIKIFDALGYGSSSSLAADFDSLLDVLGSQNQTANHSIAELLYQSAVFLEDIASASSVSSSAFDNWVVEWRSTDKFADYFSSVFQPWFVPSGSYVLGSSGLPEVSGGSYGLTGVVAAGFLGLSQNIRTISSGAYNFTMWMSDTGENAVYDASTMGSMLNLYLSQIQRDTAQLNYLYGGEETIQAKKDAEENMEAASEEFLKPGSAGSLSAADIGSAADSVGAAKDIFSTGVTPGQAFEQLQGSGPLEFFTSITAANLDTVPATASEDDENFIHFYDPDNTEFWDLIGKGGN